jgi:hypothetical protein
MITSTLPDRRPDEKVRRARDLRRVGLTLLSVFVLLGLTGVLGTRTAEKSASAGRYDLTVTYPQVSRSGHAVRFEVEVRREGGFPAGEPVRLRVLGRYYDLFDENGFSPQPDAETADDRYVYDEFAPPDGDTLLVSVDTRIEPARNSGEDGEVSVLDEDGRPVTTVRFHTYLVP